MWSNYLKMLISSGLLLSFPLISCSADTINNSIPTDAKKGSTTEGNPGFTGTTQSNGNTTGSGDGVAPPIPPEHWISPVPFQKIEAESFIMGSPNTESDRASDETQVEVTITKPFEIMTTEVTQNQWLNVMDSNPSEFKSAEVCGDDYDAENDMCPNNPVEQISWDDVQEYIKKLNESLKLTGCNGTPSSSPGCYRLPTEAEWEYATRGGTNTAYSFGDDFSSLGDYGWYKDNSDGKTHPVGEKKPNGYGLYDIHGNVWELVQDMYADPLPGGINPLQITPGSHRIYREDDTDDRNTLAIIQHTSNSYRVIRGGSWFNNPWVLRSANRSAVEPVGRFANIGFRLVRTL